MKYIERYFLLILLHKILPHTLHFLIYFQRIKNSYAIHLFNGITSKIPILTGKEDSGLGQLVKKHCPIVYEGGMW